MSETEKLEEFLNRDGVQIVTSKDNIRKVIEKSGGKVQDDTIRDSEGNPETNIRGTKASFSNLESMAAGSKIFIEDTIAGFSEYLTSKLRE